MSTSFFTSTPAMREFNGRLQSSSMRHFLFCRVRSAVVCTISSCRRIHSDNLFWTTLNSAACSSFLDRTASNLLATKTGVDLYVSTDSPTISYWEQIYNVKTKFDSVREEIEQLDQLEATEGADQTMKKMIEKDREALHEALNELVERLVEAIIPGDPVELLNKSQMEFSSGAGGTEAMMFTSELMQMYEKFCQKRGWSWTIFELESGQHGGARSALVSIDGVRSYSTLRFEAGVHRVQRIPQTDKTRIHTSTASVSVLPEPEEAQVEIPSHEVEYEAIRASGPGGQNVNKRSSAVRLTHLPTGIAVHCMDERFQHLNLQIAFKRLGAILLQQKVDEQQGRRTSARRLQVGSKARAEKVRTYNFKDDRITDHRLKLSTTNIEDFMNAGFKFDYFIDELSRLNRLERLSEVINSTD